MAGRIFAGVVVVFWLAMMVALVRWEMLPHPVPLDGIAPERIVQRIFRRTEPSRLTLLYVQGTVTNWVGACQLDINPFPPPDAKSGDSGAPEGYRLTGDLKMDLVMLGFPSRLRVVGEAQFDARYEVERFHVKADMADGRIELRCDDRQHVLATFDFGEFRDRRQFDLRDLQTANLGGLGLPGLTPLARNSGVRASQQRLIAARDQLRLAHGWLRCFLLEYKLDERTRLRAWISELGEILRVDTPWGLLILDDALVPGPVMRWRHPNRHELAQPLSEYDSHRATY